MIRNVTLLFCTFLSVIAFSSCDCGKEPLTPQEDTSGFVLVADVIPDAILEIRYYCSYNFIGERIPGYEEPYPDTYFTFPVRSSSVAR